MRVDFPAPFSPMMPWMEPGAMASDTSLLAWTEPKRLSMPISSMAGVMPFPFQQAEKEPPPGWEGGSREAYCTGQVLSAV